MIGRDFGSETDGEADLRVESAAGTGGALAAVVEQTFYIDDDRGEPLDKGPETMS